MFNPTLPDDFPTHRGLLALRGMGNTVLTRKNAPDIQGLRPSLGVALVADTSGR